MVLFGLETTPTVTGIGLEPLVQFLVVLVARRRLDDLNPLDLPRIAATVQNLPTMDRSDKAHFCYSSLLFQILTVLLKPNTSSYFARFPRWWKGVKIRRASQNPVLSALSTAELEVRDNDKL